VRIGSSTPGQQQTQQGVRFLQDIMQATVYSTSLQIRQYTIFPASIAHLLVHNTAK
jgi:uncharacterized RmlC-like cupin family protein